MNRRPFAARRAGFTLVELLVVVTIIAILAGIVLGGLQVARNSARIDRTKATIGKLHALVMAKYESYRTRRVPVTTAGMAPLAAAQARLFGLRELMRMEMPDRFTDITAAPLNFAGGPVSQPALARRYAAQYAQRTPSAEFGAAECLYLVVSAMGPEAVRQFSESEIGDVDGDGYREFVDGWGNPIRFLRWAPAFNDSEIQPNIDPPGDSTQMAAAALNDHDPFDSRRVDARAWRIVPLIYSAGPDGIYDIDIADGYAFNGNNIYFDASNAAQRLGLPLDSMNSSLTTGNDQPANGRLDHWDNIHNHRIEAE